MTDPQGALGRYLRQQVALGEDRLVLHDATLARGVAHPAPGSTGAPATRGEESRPRPRGRRVKGRPPRDEASAAPARGVRAGATEASGWRKGAPAIPPTGVVVPPADTSLFNADPLAGATMDVLNGMVRTCTKCGLCEGRTNAVPGEGPANAKLLVVGEGPGATEDELGRPFVGRAGKLLDDILSAIECPRETAFIANVVKCRPPNNRNPEREEINACLPYLYRQIELIRPRVILAMGSTAANTLLNGRGSLSSLRNRVHQFRGTPLIATYHPAALLRNPHWKKPTWDDVRIARRIIAGDG